MYRKNTITLFLFIFGVATMCSDTLDEYTQYLFQLRNYNTLGFMIFATNSDSILYQRGELANTGNTLNLVPSDKGLFQFMDSETNKLMYTRNAILFVSYRGIICNIDGFSLYPEIKVDVTVSYQISFEHGKLTIFYPDTGVSVSHEIALYWPQTLPQSVVSGVYFDFNDAISIHNAYILSGFIELSATNVQETIIKMLGLLSDIKYSYGTQISFASGDSDITISILLSLLAASYTVKIEPPLLIESESIADYMDSGRIPDTDPLQLRHIGKYLNVFVKDTYQDELSTQ